MANMKRVSGREVILAGTRPAIALRHEQNYTYDNVTLKEGIAQLGKHLEDQAGNERGQKRKFGPSLLNAEAVKVSRVWQNVLI